MHLDHVQHLFLYGYGLLLGQGLAKHPWWKFKGHFKVVEQPLKKALDNKEESFMDAYEALF